MWPARAGMLGKRIRGGQVEGRVFLMGAKEWGREDMSRVGRHARVVPLDMAEREGGRRWQCLLGEICEIVDRGIVGMHHGGKKMI